MTLRDRHDIAMEKPRIRAKSRAAMFLHRLLPVLLLLATPARADRLELVPPTATVAIRFYGLGFLPIEGNYTRFHGWLTYDPADRAHCQAELTVDTASLAMGNASFRDEVVGPELMDVARFPTLTFNGVCQAQTLEGDLTMHGVTHGFALSMDWQRAEVVATGSLRRAEWGMTARPLLGGPTARIRVRVALPAAAAGGAER
jgi:polyisoprenoid-binding protein YceI